LFSIGSLTHAKPDRGFLRGTRLRKALQAIRPIDVPGSRWPNIPTGPITTAPADSW
jgi:hypothetical protein